MTALIYKAALPTYTSLAELSANAGESLLLNDAGTAYELEPGQSGATVHPFAWAVVSTATWTHSANDVVTTSGSPAFPEFNTQTGDTTDFGLALTGSMADAWGPGTPTLLTAGIYQVTFRVEWPVNVVGQRVLRLQTFDANYTTSFPPIMDFRLGTTGALVGDQVQRLCTNVYVWTDLNPIGIGVTVGQDSGSTLTALKAGVRVIAHKLASFG